MPARQTHTHTLSSHTHTHTRAWTCMRMYRCITISVDSLCSGPLLKTTGAGSCRARAWRRAKSPSPLTPQAREHLGLARLGMSTVIYLSGMKLWRFECPILASLRFQDRGHVTFSFLNILEYAIFLKLRRMNPASESFPMQTWELHHRHRFIYWPLDRTLS